MRAPQWFSVLAAALAAVIAGGCNGPAKRSVTTTEPGLSSTAEPGVSMVETPGSTRSTTFVDRHPLFSKPRQYYESTNNNKVVKTAAATVVGVPAGIYGELKQIVAGNTSPTVTPY